MPSAAILKLGAAVRNRLGQPATLDGQDCGNVRLAMGQRVEEQGIVVTRTVATLDRAANPRRGQTLVHPDGTFRLERLLADNGVNVQFIVQ